jgi:hypothetical protein
MNALDCFREVWLADFEFSAPPGERPAPLCLVAREYRSGRLLRVWQDALADEPPVSIGADSLFVAYYASAELGCFMALNWPTPARILDLFAEFRNVTNGLATVCGSGLLGALVYFGLPAMDAAEKATMRDLAQRGGPHTREERLALLDYCQSDVDALARLLQAMLPKIDMPRALLRGRYMAAAARMEWNGIPLDAGMLERLKGDWDGIKRKLVAAVDTDYGVFVATSQRVINPETARGAAILDTAKDWNIDAHQLADAVDMVWFDERQSLREIHEARQVARTETGLTRRRISQLEESGRDYSHVPGLDVKARELAGRLPALGIGPGYRVDDGPEDIDYASRLWEQLRERNEEKKPRHDPAILQCAAELVAANPTNTTVVGLTFSGQRWADYLAREGIPWPRLASCALALDDDTFHEMARAYPQVAPIRELRHALSQLQLQDLCIGSDGRNRCLLSAFRARTGRNQPSNSQFIFGPSVWLRGLIRPGPGRALAYVDWSQQELAIAARLSQDDRMQDAYRSGDFYLTFAKMAGAVPSTGTKDTHKAEREQFKTVALGVLYGLGADGLARKLAVAPCKGRELLRMHKETFPRFWAWSDSVEMFAMLYGYLETVFGWRVHVGPDANPRSLRNFPMQAHGAEMLRLACCLATERGIAVCAPVHDALLVEGPARDIEDVVFETQWAMAEASEFVLPGFILRTEAKIVRYPERYMDPRGVTMWDKVCRLLDGTDRTETPTTRGRGCAPGNAMDTPTRDGRGPLPPVVTPSSLISLSI